MGNQEKPTAEAAGAPRKPKKKVEGFVYLNPARCKGCGFCIAFCPPQVLEFSDEFNAQGYHPPYLAHPEGCTGCDLCGLYCPDFAIYSVMVKREPRSADEPEPTSGGSEQ
jgi:2-oxoglutarate ferredoxin oxidoreductase subunit delta